MLAAVFAARRARAVAPLRDARRAGSPRTRASSQTANPRHRARAGGAAEMRAARRGGQRPRRGARGAAGGRRAPGARRERPHRAGAQPARRADVRARAERGRVQRRGPHPAVQRARDAAAAQAARRRPPPAGAHAGGPRPLDLRDLRPQPHRPRARDMHDRIQQGERATGRATSSPRAPAGQLVRVQLAPVLGARMLVARAIEGIAGFVLLLDDITRAVESGQPPRPAPAALTRGTRASLANMRAAVETHRVVPRTWSAPRRPLHRRHRRGGRTLSAHLDTAVARVRATRCAPRGRSRTCAAPTCRGARAAASRAASSCRPSSKRSTTTIWLNVDSYSLMQALDVPGRAARATSSASRDPVRAARPRRARAPRPVLDRRAARVRDHDAWQTDSMELGGEACPMTLTQIIERHDAEIWYQIDKPAAARILPHRRSRAATRRSRRGSAAPAAHSRPEFYDFDLFDQPGQSPSSTTGRSPTLIYTVFDTETTGPRRRPTATRSSRSAPCASSTAGCSSTSLRAARRPAAADVGRGAARSTGIDDAMLADQPTIDQVLPAFRAFAEDTVLSPTTRRSTCASSHLKEAATGVRLHQPVLDTLLLSAVIHPELDARTGWRRSPSGMGVNRDRPAHGARRRHRHRRGVPALLPLLAEQGIRTLGRGARGVPAHLLRAHRVLKTR